MRIFNENKSIELQQEHLDFKKGYLKNDILTKHIPYKAGVKEQAHYEIIKEYDNGGKKVKKIIDIEAQPEILEHTEEEEIMVFIPYTAEEIKQHELQEEYNTLVEWFNTDYTKDEQKLRRLYTMQKLTDNNTNPYDELLLLYEQAESKRRRIQEIEGLLNG